MCASEIKEEHMKIVDIVLVVVILGVILNMLASILYDFVPIELKSLTGVVLFTSAVFTALYFVGWRIVVKPITIEESFPVVFPYNKKDCYIPSTYFIGYQAMFDAQHACQELFKKAKEYKEKLHTGNISDKFFMDLIEYLTIMWLSQEYHIWWAFKKPIRHIGITSYKAEEKPSRRLTFTDLPESVRKDNIFFVSFYNQQNSQIASDFRQFTITLPKGTELYLEPKDPKTILSKKIILVNRYCKISLGLGVRGWRRGVGSYGLLGALFYPLGSLDPLARSAEQEKINEFATIRYEIIFSASFNRLKRLVSYLFSWLPWVDNMDDYYNWAEDMKERLRHHFDWDFYLKTSPDPDILRVQAGLVEIKCLVRDLLNKISEKSV